MGSIQQLDDKVSMVIFNVKGSDLLSIDQPTNLDDISGDWENVARCVAF